MKKIINLILCIILISAVYIYIDPITNKIAELLKYQPTVVIKPPNSYYRDLDFKYVKQNKDFIPYSKQDLKDIFYSVLNSGYESFTFYCPKEYSECVNDVKLLSDKNSETLPNINNFLHPLNAFKHLDVLYDETGEITIETQRLYTNEEITKLNNEVDRIINEVIKPDMDDEEKILTIHDYLINKTKYDLTYDPNKEINERSIYKSNMAIGPLFDGYAICSGYTDAMALFLNKFNIPNYKVASQTHIWNAVYINERWLHLDLTWDDPVDEKNKDKNNLIHKFFLINTSSLKANAITDHDFDTTIYQELEI